MFFTFLYSEVLQGSTLDPLLYSMHTADIPLNPDTFLVSYTEAKDILYTDPDPLQASPNVRTAPTLASWREGLQFK